MPARPASPTTLVLQRESQWVLWTHRGSKGKRNIRDRWDAWPDAIRESLGHVRPELLHEAGEISGLPTPPRLLLIYSASL